MHKVIDYISESGTEVLEEGDKDGADILVSLTYIGKNREKDNGIKLTRTFKTARKNNEKSNITSALVNNSYYFIKNIENSRFSIKESLVIVILGLNNSNYSQI